MRRIVVILGILLVLGITLFWLSRPKPIPVTVKEVALGKVE